MIRNLLFFPILLSMTLIPVNGRDPFWPIGYEGTEEKVETAVQAVEVKPQVRELSDEELREVARQEAERIRQSLVMKGTLKTGSKIYAYVQNNWVSAGDFITVEVEGLNYRLEILSLTTDNIELKAHRALAPLQLTPRK